MKLFMQQTFSLAEILYVCLPGTDTQSVGYSPRLISLTSKGYTHQLLSLITTLAFLCMLIWMTVGFTLSVYCGEKKMLRIMKAVECLRKVIV